MRRRVYFAFVSFALSGCGGGGLSSSGNEPRMPPTDDASADVNVPSSNRPAPPERPDSAAAPEVVPETASAIDTPPEAGQAVSVDAAPASPDGLGYKDFSCSWVLGIHTTYEWFVAGFEKVVDDARWQVSGIEMAQFEWANPSSNLWNSPITSPCASNTKTPDRIVFTGVDGGSTTVGQFLPQYLSVIKIIKTRFPSVKRVDLMTLARAPGDVECKGANRSGSSWIRPGQDDAIAMMVAMFPGFVFSTPKWEVKSCSDFGLCPHISAAANAELAKTIGAYFLAN